MTGAEPGIGRDLPTPDRVLAIGAHPDDVEFGCGGTLAKWSAAGAHVELVVLTDGSKGTWDPDADLVALVEQRRGELREAASALGIREIHALDFVDGELESGPRERGAVCEIIREVRPDLVLAHDPWKRYRLHPDHFHAGRATVDAIVAARDPHFFPALGPPHRPSNLLLFEPDETDHLESLDEKDIQKKVAALLSHRSQWQSTMGLDPSRPDTEAFAEKIRREAEQAGEPAALDQAEQFKLMTDL